MRRLLAGAAVTFFISSPIASAAPGASFRFVAPGPKHTFTLNTARRLIVSEQRHDGSPLHAIHCFWAAVHRAGCQGVWVGTELRRWNEIIVSVGGPQPFIMTDWATRAGPCSTTVVKRTGPNSGIAHSKGSEKRHNCFTGPLVVEQGPVS